MKDFKGGMGRAKSSLDRPWNPGTTKGRFDSIVTGPGWTVPLLFDNPGLGQVLFAHLMYEKHFFQKIKQNVFKIVFIFKNLFFAEKNRENRKDPFFYTRDDRGRFRQNAQNPKKERQGTMKPIRHV